MDGEAVGAKGVGVMNRGDNAFALRYADFDQDGFDGAWVRCQFQTRVGRRPAFRVRISRPPA